jgi:ankyrin repeat protein
MWASAAGNIGVIETLCSMGPDLNAIDDVSFRRPSLFPKKSLLICYLRFQRIQKGKSSLIYACSRQQLEAAKFLISAGASVDICDSVSWNQTAECASDNCLCCHWYRKG